MPCPNTSGIDFFVQKLEPGTCYWVNPPIDYISDAITKLLNASENIVAILSVPVWQHRSFWHQLSTGDYFRPFVKKVLVSNPTYINNAKKSSMFRGKKGFLHAFLLIETKRSYYTPVPKNLRNTFNL